MKEQESQMSYAFCCMTTVAICIVCSLLQCLFKLAWRRFTRLGRAAAVENDDQSIEGKFLRDIQTFFFFSLSPLKRLVFKYVFDVGFFSIKFNMASAVMKA